MSDSPVVPGASQRTVWVWELEFEAAAATAAVAPIPSGTRKEKLSAVE